MFKACNSMKSRQFWGPYGSSLSLFSGDSRIFLPFLAVAKYSDPDLSVTRRSSVEIVCCSTTAVILDNARCCLTASVFQNSKPSGEMYRNCPVSEPRCTTFTVQPDGKPEEQLPAPTPCVAFPIWLIRASFYFSFLDLRFRMSIACVIRADD